MTTGKKSDNWRSQTGKSSGNLRPLPLDLATCEICGQRMLDRNCKIICPNCGFTRDCSDP